MFVNFRFSFFAFWTAFSLSLPFNGHYKIAEYAKLLGVVTAVVTVRAQSLRLEKSEYT